MVAETTERQMTDAEIQMITPRLTGFPRNLEELREFVGQVASLSFGLSFFAVLIWLLVAWLFGLVADVEFGLNSTFGTTIFWSIVAVALAYTVYEVQRTNKPTAARTRELLADIDEMTVRVERYAICGVKVLQEQEHGGLFYFLLTSEDRIYVACDYESQELGVEGKDPLGSSFAPKSVLRIEKTPHSGSTLVEKFEGQTLDVPTPIAMTNKTRRWPEPEEFVSVPWESIEEIYGQR